MDYAWDSTKRADTLRERGLDFADADQAFRGPYLELIDDRFYYGEKRLVRTAMGNGDVVIIVWTQRPNSRRIISMRKANAKETARYRDAVDRSG